jgi:phosphatidylethanolamine-binding protein (PEBP) family uncharacterized protein
LKKKVVNMNVFKKIVISGLSLLSAITLFGCQPGTWGIEVQNKPDAFLLSSPSFLPGDPLPDAFTCEGKTFGEGVLPELNWTPGPEGTKSYVIVLKDLTLVNSATPDYAYHWAIWDIPSTITSLPEGLEENPILEDLGGAQQLNGGPEGAAVYFGPCPSWQHACSNGDVLRNLDIYAFTIYAMDVEKLTLPNADLNINNYVRQLDAFFASKAIEKTEIIVTSNASPSVAPVFCPANN